MVVDGAAEPLILVLVCLHQWLRLLMVPLETVVVVVMQVLALAVGAEAVQAGACRRGLPAAGLTG